MTNAGYYVEDIKEYIILLLDTMKDREVGRKRNTNISYLILYV